MAAMGAYHLRGSTEQCIFGGMSGGSAGRVVGTRGARRGRVGGRGEVPLTPTFQLFGARAGILFGARHSSHSVCGMSSCSVPVVVIQRRG